MSTGRVGLLHLLFVSLLLSVGHHFSHGVEQESPLLDGNVGCLFSDQVCNDEEICFNDLVFGRCISTSSSYEDLARFPFLSEEELGQLEVEMGRVFNLGYSWPDMYTQCVFQSLLHTIQYSQEYSRETCDHLESAQQQEYSPLVETQQEDQDQDQDDEDYSEGGWRDLSDLSDFTYAEPEYAYESPLTANSDDAESNNQDDNDDFPGQMYNLPPDEQYDDSPLAESLIPYSYQNADYRLQNYPRQIPLSKLVDDDLPSFNQIQNTGFTRRTRKSPRVLDDELTPSSYSYPSSSNYHLPSYNSPSSSSNLLSEFPSSSKILPYHDDPNQILLGPDENNNNYNPDSVLTPIDRIDDADIIENGLPNSYAEDYSLSNDNLGNVENVPEKDDSEDDIILPVDEDDLSDDNFNQIRTNFRQRRNNEEVQSDAPETVMDALYDDQVRNSQDQDYDFDYETNQEEPLYYNIEDGPIPIETVFNRRERLDVKKPGPFYKNSQNNFFLDKLTGETKDEKENETSENTENLYDNQRQKDNKDQQGQTEYEMPLSPPGPRPKKDIKEKVVGILEAEPVQNENYLYINIKDRFKAVSQGSKLIEFVADHLAVPLQFFSSKPTISKSQLAVQVFPNPRQLNASLMAEELNKDEDMKADIKDKIGVDIDNFAVGSEVDSQDSVRASHLSSSSSPLLLPIFLMAAASTSLLLIAAVLLLIRRRSKSITKSVEEDNTTPIPVAKEEPVAEYKQLCRDWSRSSRASNGSNGSNGAGAAGAAGATTAGAGAAGGGAGKEEGRVVAAAASSPSKAKPQLNKSRENSAGSRTSSSSSWNEEPGVSSMDISTGHMVLSYMEDHLKNKQRLEQEWVGLCAYEAEPSATTTAFKVENKKKNRFPDKLPYDHNRVLLNPLTNGSSSDYINASTVMDHDPRNPAYIVTQGPLAHTAADFWQMVWEQGSVVIVMLTKLQENGYHLAHRYWPEEGSEQYHIFEVHLVSEHVWCDDYLVRSVYLRNTQTGETRTVTQFHFLSWPQTGVPTSTKAILEFRRKVNKSYRGRSCPIIVHCSDGVGRSGTYILIDMVLNRMTKGSKEIDIAATLEHIRDQRCGMVQSRSQFEFCLMAVAEETHAILKALPQ